MASNKTTKGSAQQAATLSEATPPKDSLTPLERLRRKEAEEWTNVMTSGKRNWYYQIGDQVHGPMSHLDVRERAAAGEIGPDTLIRWGHDEWQRADHVYFLSEFFPPVERSEDWWQEISRSGISKEIQECKGNLILLVVSCLLLLAVVLVCSLLDAAGKAGVVARMVEKALPIALLLLGGGIIKSIFGLWMYGWEATREAARMIWAELRRPSE